MIPEAPAGSVVLFSEALTHGTAPWTATHRRRTLIYKYCQSHIAWSTRRVPPPASVPLTPRQQILFQKPANRGAGHVHGMLKWPRLPKTERSRP